MSYLDFTEMPVWQKGFSLVVQVYEVTKCFPDNERYGLISDMRRAANSVVHNLAEGFGRFESHDKTRFYKISRGSAYELISQVLVAFKLGYIKDEKVKGDIISSYKEVIIAEDALIKSIESKKTK